MGNEETFKQIYDKEIVKEMTITGERKVLAHQNSEVNFNLPMDMGGLGPLFNKDRYSRVS